MNNKCHIVGAVALPIVTKEVTKKKFIQRPLTQKLAPKLIAAYKKRGF